LQEEKKLHHIQKNTYLAEPDCYTGPVVQLYQLPKRFWMLQGFSSTFSLTPEDAAIPFPGITVGLL
jgi:hypothetical protein